MKDSLPIILHCNYQLGLMKQTMDAIYHRYTSTIIVIINDENNKNNLLISRKAVFFMDDRRGKYNAILCQYTDYRERVKSVEKYNNKSKKTSQHGEIPNSVTDT